MKLRLPWILAIPCVTALSPHVFFPAIRGSLTGFFGLGHIFAATYSMTEMTLHQGFRIAALGEHHRINWDFLALENTFEGFFFFH